MNILQTTQMDGNDEVMNDARKKRPIEASEEAIRAQQVMLEGRYLAMQDSVVTYKTDEDGIASVTQLQTIVRSVRS